ncbi:MAG: M28 family peptidase [Balneolaceae bacterium]|nr:MAG: M28 family peptidase [Balneolaceae bacterium]
MTRSVRVLTLISIFILSCSVSAQASDPYTQAYLKWDAGNYIEALEDFLEILNGPDAHLYFDDIASLTGELYIVDEISDDGRNPVFSPDNRHFAWQENSGGFITTKIARISETGVEHLHTLEGRDILFSPDGRHGVVMRTTISSRMEELQQELNDAFEARDRSAIIAARNSLQYEQAVNTSLYRVNLASGETAALNTGELMVRTPAFDAEGGLWFAGKNPNHQNRSDIYSMSIEGSSPNQITEEPGFYDAPQPTYGGEMIVFNSYPSSPFPTPANADRHTYDTASSIILHHLQNGAVNRWEGQAPVISKSGNRLAFLRPGERENSIYSVEISANAGEATEMVSSSYPIQHPALSPDGSKLAYMLREGISWDIHMVHTEAGSHERLSFDIQHELFPHFLNNDKVLGMMGEARHRRSHIYDVNTKEFYRLFHNNSVRTVSMENEWEPSPNGNHLLIVAQRSGNTIAPEQGVYLVRIGERISKEALVERLQKNLESEQLLLANAEEMYAPIFDEVKAATEEINITRLYHYQKSLYDFGSKHMTMPGNQKASEYIYETLKSFGYEPELQWFNPGGDIQTANVIARLEGTTHPEVVYILSSHFDSVQRSPGADDNSTGTAVLLEAARVLANNPQPATIIFASLTAEESGLLGAREFVRVAEEEGLWAAGVVNNDMMGWTRHHRLDNTIRFSNYGIRDVQHSGAILFSDLITYDSRYYRNTDAQVFFEAYGDVIGGIGSYPILGNPNYHQPTDRLETINHRLVQEVSRSTTATLMMLANAPSKVTGLEVRERSGNRAEVRWNALQERDIDHYVVSYTDTTGNEYTEQTSRSSITLRRVDMDKPISVVGVNARGITGWDVTALE